MFDDFQSTLWATANELRATMDVAGDKYLADLVAARCLVRSRLISSQPRRPETEEILEVASA